MLLLLLLLLFFFFFMMLENEIHQMKEQVPFTRSDRALSTSRKKLVLKDLTCILKIKMIFLYLAIIIIIIIIIINLSRDPVEQEISRILYIISYTITWDKIL